MKEKLKKLLIFIKYFHTWLFISSPNPKQGCYSYKSLLTETLKKKKPKKIIEWGSGRSTMLMKKICPDAEIHSIESDFKWHLRWRLSIFGVHLYYIPVNKGFIFPDCPEKYFDFAFVDGKSRVQCMKTALKLLKDDGLLILHDSNSKKLKPGIKLFKLIKEKNNTMLLKKQDV
jgi:hypothetical protein